jgi:hypothetical protein
MFRIIPHIYKGKVSRTLYFPLKYSDLESYFLVEINRDLHLDVWFHANHSHWLTKRSRTWRDRDYTMISLTYSPGERFRYGAAEELPHSTVVRCHVYALPVVLARDVGLTRSELTKEVASALGKIATGGFFDRRWQLTARLRIRERLLQCVSLAWKHATPTVLSNQLVDLNEDRKPPCKRQAATGFNL